ncbi:MAG: PD-(D/E)XK nuclease family transposase [Gallionella sp.]|nr:PD-(D/E)XK nuclease family transposase [Gallionella sp.]
MERKRFIEYSDDVELIFVELPKFTLILDELATIQDKWIFFLKNAGSMEYIPDTLASDPGINQAFSFANEAAMSREELEIQFKRRDFIILQRGSLILAESKGFEKGIEIGIEQGMQQGEALALQKLLTKRFGVIAPDITARIAAASAEQIEAWFDLAIDAAQADDVFDSTAH